MFQKSDKSRSSLLNTESKELGRDRREAKNAILLTWQISFEHIHAVRRTATKVFPEILVRCKTSIILETVADDGEVEGGHGDDIESFEHDIDALRDYSFISITPGRFTSEMHHLVQLAAQLWLKEKEQFQWWRAKSAEARCCVSTP